MTSTTTAQSRDLPPTAGILTKLEPGTIGLWLVLAVAAVLVFPPLYFLVETSLTVGKGAAATRGLANYTTVLALGGWDLWQTTLLYAAGSSVVAIVLGVSSSWLVARTNAPFRQIAFVGAFLSLAAPVIIKGIGWILLLGPNSGVINLWLKSAFNLTDPPIELYTLGGMIFIEGVLWTPVVFLLTLAPLSAMDPALEEAAAMSGARLRQTLWRVTLPLAWPSVLAVLLLTFIRSLESFEVPLLIGVPGGMQTFTTVIYQSINTGFLPKYGEASAYATLLLLAVAVPLIFYYRATRETQRYATVTGKGFRPQRLDLGRWKWPCGLWLLIIPLSLGAPLLIMLWASFLPLYTVPTLADFDRMTWANYASVWARPDTVSGLWNSILVATASATAVAVLTFIAAWLVVRRREAIRWVIDLIVSLPLVFPGIVLGIAVLIQFLNVRWIPIYGTVWILVFAFLLKFMPYGMRFCYSGILSIHRELEESARVSGASTAKVLWAVVLPLTMPAVIAVWLYVFLHTIRDLSISIFLSGPQNQVVSVVILDLWDNGEVPELAALSVVLAIGVTILGLVFMRLSRRYQYNG
jgi:iron(III) transport system permease protein